MPTCAAAGARNGRSDKRSEKTVPSGTRAVPTRTAHTTSPTPLVTNSPTQKIGYAGGGSSADPRMQRRATPQRDRLCQIQPNSSAHPSPGAAPHVGCPRTEQSHQQETRTLLPLRRPETTETVLPQMYPTPHNFSPTDTTAIWQQKPRDKGFVPSATKIVSTRADPATARNSAPSLSFGGASSRPSPQPSSCTGTPSQPSLALTHPPPSSQLNDEVSVSASYARQFPTEAPFGRTTDTWAFPTNSARRGRSPSPLTGQVYSPRKLESSGSLMRGSSSHAPSPLDDRNTSDGTKAPSMHSSRETPSQHDTCFTFTQVEHPSFHSPDSLRYVFPQSPIIPATESSVEMPKRPPSSPQKNAIPSVVRLTRQQQQQQQQQQAPQQPATTQPGPPKPQQAAPKSAHSKKAPSSTGSSSSAKKGPNAASAPNGNTPPSAPLVIGEDAGKLKERRRRELYAWNVELKKQKETLYTEDAV